MNSLFSSNIATSSKGVYTYNAFSLLPCVAISSKRKAANFMATPAFGPFNFSWITGMWLPIILCLSSKLNWRRTSIVCFYQSGYSRATIIIQFSICFSYYLSSSPFFAPPYFPPLLFFPPCFALSNAILTPDLTYFKYSYIFLYSASTGLLTLGHPISIKLLDKLISLLWFYTLLVSVGYTWVVHTYWEKWGQMGLRRISCVSMNLSKIWGFSLPFLAIR